MTTQYTKEISYDRETRDYAAHLDGELVGYFRTYHAAEVELDRLVYDLLEQATPNTCTAAFCGEPATHHLAFSDDVYHVCDRHVGDIADPGSPEYDAAVVPANSAYDPDFDELALVDAEPLYPHLDDRDAAIESPDEDYDPVDEHLVNGLAAHVRAALEAMPTTCQVCSAPHPTGACPVDMLLAAQGLHRVEEDEPGWYWHFDTGIVFRVNDRRHEIRPVAIERRIRQKADSGDIAALVEMTDYLIGHIQIPEELQAAMLAEYEFERALLAPGR